MTLYEFMAKVDADIELKELTDFIRFAQNYLDFIRLDSLKHLQKTG